MSESTFTQLTASALAELYRRREASPVEVVEAVLARIAHLNPLLCAYATLDPEGARAAARASEVRWHAGTPASPIDGVPLSVKDNLVVAGLRSTWGSRLYADWEPDADELPVARLRAAGLVIVGKTNVPEFTLQGYTHNLLFGTTHNPWCHGRTPGGSSGGAAAAVAAGLAPIAMATDGGGSIRRPAGYTGLVGVKPSTGRVARAGGFPVILQDFEVAGSIARSVADALMLMNLLAGDHPVNSAEHGAKPASNFALPDSTKSGAPGDGFAATHRRLRILAIARLGDAPLDRLIEASFNGVLARFSALGHVIETVTDLPAARIVNEQVFPVVAAAGLAWLLRRFPSAYEVIGAGVLPIAEAGTAASAADLVAALDARDSATRAVQRLFETHDVLLTPTAAAMPWAASEPAPASIAGHAVGPRGHAVYTAFANAAGLPGVSLPGPPAPDGQPIGFQLVGRHGADALLGALAQQYEIAWPWAERWPLPDRTPRQQSPG